MLTGSAAHPERALRLLHELELCRCIFLPPQKLPVLQGDGTPHDLTHEQALWDQGYKYAAEMYQLMVQQTGQKELQVDQLPEEEQTLLRVRVLSSFLLPFADYYVMEKKRQVLLPCFIIRDSLKVICEAYPALTLHWLLMRWCGLLLHVAAQPRCRRRGQCGSSQRQGSAGTHTDGRV